MQPAGPATRGCRVAPAIQGHSADGTGVKLPRSDIRKIKLSNTIDGAGESEAAAATKT